MNLACPGRFCLKMDNADMNKPPCEGRKLLKNASYFAFTATPKNKTLETFGCPIGNTRSQATGLTTIYTMKQAIQKASF
jgi:type I restriction enzyme R subunit